MKRILLACHGGFSTSMLVRKMEENAKSRGIDISIDAVPEDDVVNHEADIILLGPQIAHRVDSLREDLNIPVYVIDSFDYGTMNGENVLNHALEKLGEEL